MSTLRGAQIIHGLEDLRVGLAQAQHQAGLGQHLGPVPLGVRQHGQRLLVAGARIAHRMRQAPHGLDVLREHLQAGIDHGFHVAQHALEIRRQRFDRGLRSALA